jgi:hypothetical protein
MFRKLVFGTAAAVSAALAAGMPALPASAVLRTGTNQYADVADGTAGYYASNGTSFRNAGAVILTSASALNIGGVGKGGIGVQLCDPNNGFGLQDGITSNGSTFTVEYATGILKGANADNCVGNGLLASPHVLNANLAGLPVGDAVTVYESYRLYRKANGTRKQGRGGLYGVATFQAMDNNGFEVFTADVWKLPADRHLTMAGAGVQQDTTGLTGSCAPVVTSGLPQYQTAPLNKTGACNDAADFSGVFADGTGGIGGFAGNGSGDGLAHWTTTETVTSVGGLRANAPIVAPDHSLMPTAGTAESAFSVFTA